MGEKLTKAQKELLDQFSMPIVDWFDKASDEEVLALLNATTAVSETNCWFLHYRLAQALRPLAEYESARRSERFRNYSSEISALPDTEGR